MAFTVSGNINSKQHISGTSQETGVIVKIEKDVNQNLSEISFENSSINAKYLKDTNKHCSTNHSPNQHQNGYDVNNSVDNVKGSKWSDFDLKDHYTQCVDVDNDKRYNNKNCCRLSECQIRNAKTCDHQQRHENSRQEENSRQLEEIKDSNAVQGCYSTGDIDQLEECSNDSMYTTCYLLDSSSEDISVETGQNKQPFTHVKKRTENSANVSNSESSNRHDKDAHYSQKLTLFSTRQPEKLSSYQIDKNSLSGGFTQQMTSTNPAFQQSNPFILHSFSDAQQSDLQSYVHNVCNCQNPQDLPSSPLNDLILCIDNHIYCHQNAVSDKWMLSEVHFYTESMNSLKALSEKISTFNSCYFTCFRCWERYDENLLQICKLSLKTLLSSHAAYIKGCRSLQVSNSKFGISFYPDVLIQTLKTLFRQGLIAINVAWNTLTEAIFKKNDVVRDKRCRDFLPDVEGYRTNASKSNSDINSNIIQLDEKEADLRSPVKKRKQDILTKKNEVVDLSSPVKIKDTKLKNDVVDLISPVKFRDTKIKNDVVDLSSPVKIKEARLSKTSPLDHCGTEMMNSEKREFRSDTKPSINENDMTQADPKMSSSDVSMKSLEMPALSPIMANNDPRNSSSAQNLDDLANNNTETNQTKPETCIEAEQNAVPIFTDPDTETICDLLQSDVSEGSEKYKDETASTFKHLQTVEKNVKRSSSSGSLKNLQKSSPLIRTSSCDKDVPSVQVRGCVVLCKKVDQSNKHRQGSASEGSIQNLAIQDDRNKIQDNIENFGQELYSSEPSTPVKVNVPVCSQGTQTPKSLGKTSLDPPKQRKQMETSSLKSQNAADRDSSKSTFHSNCISENDLSPFHMLKSVFDKKKTDARKRKQKLFPPTGMNDKTSSTPVETPSHLKRNSERHFKSICKSFVCNNSKVHVSLQVEYKRKRVSNMSKSEKSSKENCSKDTRKHNFMALQTGTRKRRLEVNKADTKQGCSENQTSPEDKCGLTPKKMGRKNVEENISILEKKLASESKKSSGADQHRKQLFGSPSHKKDADGNRFRLLLPSEEDFFLKKAIVPEKSKPKPDLQSLKSKFATANVIEKTSVELRSPTHSSAMKDETSKPDMPKESIIQKTTVCTSSSENKNLTPSSASKTLHANSSKCEKNHNFKGSTPNSKNHSMTSTPNGKHHSMTSTPNGKHHSITSTPNGKHNFLSTIPDKKKILSSSVPNSSSSTRSGKSNSKPLESLANRKNQHVSSVSNIKSQSTSSSSKDKNEQKTSNLHTSHNSLSECLSKVRRCKSIETKSWQRNRRNSVASETESRKSEKEKCHGYNRTLSGSELFGHLSDTSLESDQEGIPDKNRVPEEVEEQKSPGTDNTSEEDCLPKLIRPKRNSESFRSCKQNNAMGQFFINCKQEAPDCSEQKETVESFSKSCKEKESVGIYSKNYKQQKEVENSSKSCQQSNTAENSFHSFKRTETLESSPTRCKQKEVRENFNSCKPKKELEISPTGSKQKDATENSTTIFKQKEKSSSTIYKQEEIMNSTSKKCKHNETLESFSKSFKQDNTAENCLSSSKQKKTVEDTSKSCRTYDELECSFTESSKKTAKKIHVVKSSSSEEVIPPLNRRGFPYINECFQILNKIYNDDVGEPFRHEVKSNEKCFYDITKQMYFLNFLELNKNVVPDYYVIIKRGMCLDMIAHKLRTNIYEHLLEFRQDMELIFSNCRMYHKPGSDINIKGQKAEKLFDRLYCEEFVFNGQSQELKEPN